MVFFKCAGIRVCLYQPLSITHHYDDPFEPDKGDPVGIRVLNAPFIISFRKSELGKVRRPNLSWRGDIKQKG